MPDFDYAPPTQGPPPEDEGMRLDGEWLEAPSQQAQVYALAALLFGTWSFGAGLLVGALVF